MATPANKGSTLIEVIVTTAVFTILVIATFTVYHYGNYKWKTSVMRNSMQMSVSGAMGMFEKDAKVTNLRTVSYIASTDSATLGASYPVTDAYGVSYPRCVIAFAGIDDWTKAANVSTFPKFNAYMIYIATTEQGVVSDIGGVSSPSSGRFYRIMLYPPAGSNMSGPYGELSSLANDIWGSAVQDLPTILNIVNKASYSNPTGGEFNTVQYIGPVDAFSVNTNEYVSGHEVNIIQITYRAKERVIAQEAGARGGNAYEGLQVDFTVQPQNTPPL